MSLDDPAIFEMPFLYIAGTTDFTLTDKQRANLRQFLMNGGVLFAEAAEGRQSFDAAFRAEMAKVLPGSELAALPANHAIFKQPEPIGQVKARPALAVHSGNQIEVSPEMYGIEVNGSLAVIYSPHDLQRRLGARHRSLR